MKHYAHQYYHVYNRGVNRQPIFADEYKKFVLSEIPNAMERKIAKYYLD